ncbi:MAG: hypothetical protein ACKVOL_12395 [Novosphingobium sp.]
MKIIVVCQSFVDFERRKFGLAAVVVMLMTPPRCKREWAVGLISTVVSSIGGGAAVIEHFGLRHWANSPIGLCAAGA